MLSDRDEHEVFQEDLQLGLVYVPSYYRPSKTNDVNGEATG